jgi:hypothetical protein
MIQSRCPKKGQRKELKSMTKRIVCPVCGDVTTVEAPIDEFLMYEHGARVQDAFKRLSPTMREVLITGYCPDCQALIFGAPEDEDDVS